MKILAPLVLNKKYIYAIFFILFCSCSKNLTESERENISTEIICPDNKRFMIRYAYAKEVKNAIIKDYKRKMAEKSSENFTVIRIPNVESFHINKMSPEKMMDCKITQNYINKIYPNYMKKFKKIN